LLVSIIILKLFAMKKLLFILSLTAGLAAFTGCGPTRYTVSSQPAVPYYARPAAPGVGYVWIDGDWYWRSNRYVYRHGYWARPRGHRAWVGGHWVHTPRGFYWQRGHWR
jgi:hypothetical protein